MERGYKRRNYVTDKRFQGKYVLTTVGICALGMLLAVGVFNYLSYGTIELAIWRAHVDEKTVGEIIRPHLISSNAFALFFTVVSLIVFSRFVLIKTAPPLYRIKKFIERTGEGNLNQTLDWITIDEFRDTADELNSMVSTLRERFDEIKKTGHAVIELSRAVGYTIDMPEIAAEKCSLLLENIEGLKKGIGSLAGEK